MPERIDLEAKIALVLLILSSACFAVWSQEIIVGANSQNGVPVAGAQVKITYQKDSNASGQYDGSVSGTTGADGKLSATLSNSVNGSAENRRIEARLWTYYWEGQTVAVTAGAAGASAVQFAVPYSLEKVVVAVSLQDGRPAPGATVGIYGSGLEAATDGNGEAAFYLPQGLPFTGSARLGGRSASFGSSDAAASEGGKRVNAVLKASGVATETGGNAFGVELVGTDGKPVAYQEIVVEAGGRNSSIETDAGGRAEYPFESAGTALLRIDYHGYGYSFSYGLEAGRTEKIILEPQLRIESFSVEKDGDCYVASAKVTDPRQGLPLQVRMERSVGSAKYPAEAKLGSDGRFVARICAAEGSVKAIASNVYETVESAPVGLRAPVAQPAAAAQNATNQTGAGPIAGIVLPKDSVETAFVVVVVAAAAIGAILARNQLGTQMRFISEYMRMFLRALGGKRHRGPPPIAPPAQPPTGNPPAQ